MSLLGVQDLRVVVPEGGFRGLQDLRVVVPEGGATLRNHVVLAPSGTTFCS